jgi:hypothetical protein
VYDPFVGSGTTIIAAEMTGRRCYAIEISPAYCDVAILRWQDFTEEKAMLDGRTFAEVRAARHNDNAHPAVSAQASRIPPVFDSCGRSGILPVCRFATMSAVSCRLANDQ